MRAGTGGFACEGGSRMRAGTGGFACGNGCAAAKTGASLRRSLSHIEKGNSPYKEEIGRHARHEAENPRVGQAQAASPGIK